MKQHLVIKIPTADIDAATPIAWNVFDADADLQSSGQTPLEQLPDALRGIFNAGETLVLVPGELVLMTSVRIPSRQLRQIKQALPYMVEELIADNIEDVHLALPAIKPDDNSAMPVAVVRHHLLINWLDQLYQHGIKPDWLSPDSMATPWREHSRSFFVHGERIIFRSNRFSAQVFFRGQTAAYLQLLQRQFAADELGAVPRYLVNCGVESSTAARELQQLIQAELGVEVEAAEYTEIGDEVLASEALRERYELINLLQGGYAVQRQGDGRQWLRTAKVAAAALAVYVAVSAISGIWFSWRAEKIKEQTFSYYHELFPQERRVVSPKKQMQAHLRGSAVAVSPLPLLTKAALGLRNNTMQLDELRYSQQHDDLQLQLRAPTLEALDRIKQQLSSVGLNVEIISAAQRGSETLGRIHLRES
ncbi:MAG TPA: type II secretion system protein GspL [Spongiibacteraceae bacterium]